MNYTKINKKGKLTPEQRDIMTRIHNARQMIPTTREILEHFPLDVSHQSITESAKRRRERRDK